MDLTMKSLAELQAIKDKMKDKVVLREGTGDIRVVVGMATCGIAAGARPVLNALVESVNELFHRQAASAFASLSRLLRFLKPVRTKLLTLK